MAMMHERAQTIGDIISDKDATISRLKAINADLLAALELAMMDHEIEKIELNHDTVTAARAAIAKAKGEA